MNQLINNRNNTFGFRLRLSVLLGLLILLALGCAATGDLTVDSTAVQEVLQTSPTLLETAAYATPALLPHETRVPVTIPEAAASQEAGAQPEITEAFIDGLEQQMLALINRDRQANGLQPVEWDKLAGDVARAHAQEMLRFDYLSHWNKLGQGPDVRYALAGGSEVVQENVYAYSQQYQDGSPIPITAWDLILSDAERRLMESPGHRENILNPAHTHVGVGIAYDPQTGRLRLAQEFLNRYATFSQPRQLPLIAKSGDEIRVEWSLIPPASAPFINLAYQPYPDPMEPKDLDQTGTYTPPGEVLEALPASPVGSETWMAVVRIPHGRQPGYYHILLWVELDGDPVPVGDLLVEVRE